MLQYGEPAQAARGVGSGDLKSLPVAARVVIADQQPLMLEGLAQVLRSFPTAAVERCTTGAELFSAILANEPDLAITDIRLSPPDGLTVLREVRRRGLQIPFMVVSGGLSDSEVLVSRAMEALQTRETALREMSELLTGREMQVMQMMVGRARTRDVAGRLAVSEGTLKVHLHHIYQKLNVTGRDGLIAFARAKGLV
jgi:two-component system nitrate/nitrite response regulator NarL